MVSPLWSIFFRNLRPYGCLDQFLALGDIVFSEDTRTPFVTISLGSLNLDDTGRLWQLRRLRLEHGHTVVIR